MTQERNDDPALPEGRRKAVQTQGVESLGGGKGVTDNKRTRQLELPFATAENSDRKREGDEKTTPKVRAGDGLVHFPRL